eukprot:795333-Prymnesium_polylepis.1
MAANFRLLANRQPDSACEYVGCMDPLALNYNPSAVRPGMCVDRIFGCVDSSAINFISSATDQLFIDPQTGASSTSPTALTSCRWSGCTDSAAPNFDPSASINSGLCFPIHPGCTDSRFENYAPAYNVDDGSCSRGGCTDPEAASYDSLATWSTACAVDSRRKLLEDAGHRKLNLHTGCLNPVAVNFDSNALSHNSPSCIFSVSGCTDSGAINHLPMANFEAPCVYLTY